MQEEYKPDSYHQCVCRDHLKLTLRQYACAIWLFVYIALPRGLHYTHSALLHQLHLQGLHSEELSKIYLIELMLNIHIK